MPYDRLVHDLVRIIEIAGIIVLLGGMILASVAFIRTWSRVNLGDAYHGYRADLGRAILLGLEFLVVADIIATVAMEPTFENLGVLAILVLIRTFLSFALEIEITGELPWRRIPGRAPHQPETEIAEEDRRT